MVKFFQNNTKVSCDIVSVTVHSVHSTNWLLCADCASAPSLLVTGLNSLKFTHHPASYARLLIQLYCHSLSPLSVHWLGNRVVFLFCFYSSLSARTVSRAKFGNTHIFQIISERSPLQAILLTVCVCMCVRVCVLLLFLLWCVCVCVCAHAQVCSYFFFVLCFVMCCVPIWS